MTRLSLLALFTSTALAAVCGLGALAACGGSTSSSPNDADAAIGNGNGSGSGGGGGEGGTADGSTSGEGGMSDGGKKVVTHAPVIHRATAAACSHDRGPGDFDTQLMNAQCGSDAECTMGTNGRCLSTKVAARNNYCSYDTCFTDADCAGAGGVGGPKVCTCREFPNDDNRCQAGNCKVDADCGAGGYCSPSADPDKTNFGTTGWWCHTAKDECTDDTDCNTTKREKCVFDPMLTHWRCSNEAFLPP
jgi:hypothetical protein